MDRRAAHSPVLIGDVMRLDRRFGASCDCLLEGTIRIVYLKRDVADAVTVGAKMLGRRMRWIQWCGEHEPRTPLLQRVRRHRALARLES